MDSHDSLCGSPRGLEECLSDARTSTALTVRLLRLLTRLVRWRNLFLNHQDLPLPMPTRYHAICNS